MIKPLLIALTVLLALPNFIDKDINEQLPFNHTERFHPTLTAINSIDKLESYVDMVAATRNFDVKGEGYPLLLSYIISCRFYHGFSHWKLNENWIAAAGERITGIGLSCKVQPNEILKNPYAACSQQALVMMEILKRKKIDYRKVGFPHHYAIEVKVKDEWYYYDPNMEPTMNLKQRMHESWNQNNDSLKKYYDPLKHDNLSYQFGNGEVPIFGPVNETPAKNLRLFQTATSLMSKFLWCIPLLLLLVISSRTRMRAVKPLGNTTLISIS
ncbi:MAG: hypothetical protein ABIO04_02615 [Ferruginibacter sp.]